MGNEWATFLELAGLICITKPALPPGILKVSSGKKAKDWTGRDADESLLGFSCRGSPNYCSLPLSYPCDLSQCFQLMLTHWGVQAWPWALASGWQAPCFHAARGTSRVLFPKCCWTVSLGWDPGVLQLKSQTMMNRDQELLEQRYAMSTHHGFHPRNFTLA